MTHGDELAEDPETGVCIDHEYRLANSWPGRVASIRNMEFTNEGRGGASNDYCTRKMMNFTSNWIAEGKDPRDLLVIIGWTHCNRREFYKPEERGREDYKYRSFLVPSTPEKRAFFASRVSSEETNFFGLYEKYFFAESHSVTLTLQHQVASQCYLTQMKIPYLFFNCAWCPPVDVSPSKHLSSLIDSRRFYGYDDRNLTFGRWANNNGHRDRKPRGHPNEVAHDAWAKNLSEYINQNELLKYD